MSDPDRSRPDPRKRRAASALAAGGTIEAAAGTAGVTARTVRRWRDGDETFQALLADETHAGVDRLRSARDRLVDELDRVIDTLVALLTDPETPAAVRERAARTLLDRGMALPEAKADQHIVIDMNEFWP